MGLASKLAASQAAAGPTPYPGGPPTGPPSALQAVQRPGGPPPSQAPYQPYPGGPSGGQNLSQPPYPTPSPQPPYHSRPTPNMYNSPPKSNQYSGTPPYRPVPSPQPPSSQNYQPPQWNQQPPYPPQNTYGQQPQYGQPSYQSQQPYGGGYGPPQGQAGYPPQGAQPGYPPQGAQPGYPPQGAQPGYPPQGGYGQQAQYGHQQGGPPSQPVGSGQIQAYKQVLQATIQQKGLQAFYPPGAPQLDQIAQVAAQKVDALCQRWHVTPEHGRDVIKLALFDIVLYIDDSGSMSFEEDGERIKDLKVILSRVAFAASLFDDDGVQLRFMNSPEQGNGIRNEQQVNDLISRVTFNGTTPMGTELNNRVLQPLVLGPARSGQLRKPVLIITITDGIPTRDGDRPNEKTGDKLLLVIKNAARELAGNPRYGRNTVSYQFAQVGNDVKATEFLKKLDQDPEVGPMIDCTSNYEVEAEEMACSDPPQVLTPETWLLKLLLGAIDPSWDTKDEKSEGRPQPQGGPGSYSGGPPKGGYSGPPQQGYSQPHSGYGQPPPGQGQYGQPPPGQGQHGQPPPGQGQYGQPPPGQGQYGQPPPGQGQYGQPPPGQGQYGQHQGGYGGPTQQQPGGYGRPPPNQPPYGGPQGSYGAPPPPPRY